MGDAHQPPSVLSYSNALIPTPVDHAVQSLGTAPFHPTVYTGPFPACILKQSDI